MGFSTIAAVVGAVASAGSAISGIIQGQSAADDQKKANEQAATNAAKQQKLAEDQINKASAKSPNTAGIISEAERAAKGGQSSTMLTGPSGISSDQLTLGKSTLLGG
jgi:hypothetical protein